MWALALLLLLVLVMLVTRTRRKRLPSEPPLVESWLPYLGRALDFRRNAHRFLEEQRKKHGDVFTVLIAGRHMTLVLNPLLFSSVIRHRGLDFHEFSSTVAPFVFGYSPITQDRFPGLQDQVQSAFQLLHGPNLDPLVHSMMENLQLLFREDVLSKGPGWQSCGLYDLCLRLSFEATFMTMYGRSASSRRHRGLEELRQDFISFDNMFPLLVAQVPLCLLGRTSSVRQKLISWFSPGRVSTWRSPAPFIQRRSDLFDQQEALTDHDKAAQHFAMLWASVGNTSPAMFWTVYFLLRHPEALQAVRAELQEVMSQEGRDFSPDSDLVLNRDLLDKLLVLDSVVSESLRLSTMSINVRVAQDDLSLTLDQPYRIRRGDIIALFPQSVHLDPEVYEEPTSFRFRRFLDDEGKPRSDWFKAGQKLKHFLMPFGSGASMCPGRHVALQEIKQLLCLLVTHLDLQLEDREAEPDYSRAGLGIMQPIRDVEVRYRPRQQRPLQQET